jgi:hypothetical protein
MVVLPMIRRGGTLVHMLREQPMADSGLPKPNPQQPIVPPPAGGAKHKTGAPRGGRPTVSCPMSPALRRGPDHRRVREERRSAIAAPLGWPPPVCSDEQFTLNMRGNTYFSQPVPQALKRIAPLADKTHTRRADERYLSKEPPLKTVGSTRIWQRGRPWRR